MQQPAWERGQKQDKISNKVTVRQPPRRAIGSFITGEDALKKFALSLVVIKEMTNKYPWLKAAALNVLHDN